jgi:hypothetical protein
MNENSDLRTNMDKPQGWLELSIVEHHEVTLR